MDYPDHLETPRLITRFLTKEDVGIWEDYCSDPVATRYTALPGKTPAEMAQAWIAFAMKRYAENRLGLQALISKETGEFIGQCGLLVQEVNGKREIEIGYHLLRKHWGKGYALEAAQMFRDYGFEHNFADSLISIIHPENVASQKVAMRNGMRLTEVGTESTTGFHASLGQHNQSNRVYRITREEWLQLRNA
jgi:RimJ/RimL family protein N-acetyltransferase